MDTQEKIFTVLEIAKISPLVDIETIITTLKKLNKIISNMDNTILYEIINKWKLQFEEPSLSIDEITALVNLLLDTTIGENHKVMSPTQIVNLLQRIDLKCKALDKKFLKSLVINWKTQCGVINYVSIDIAESILNPILTKMSYYKDVLNIAGIVKAVAKLDSCKNIKVEDINNIVTIWFNQLDVEDIQITTIKIASVLSNLSKQTRIKSIEFLVDLICTNISTTLTPNKIADIVISLNTEHVKFHVRQYLSKLTISKNNYKMENPDQFFENFRDIMCDQYRFFNESEIIAEISNFYEFNQLEDKPQ